MKQTLQNLPQKWISAKSILNVLLTVKYSQAS